MPINAASRSIHLPDDLAQKHDVQFIVHSRLADSSIDRLNQHLHDHLVFMKGLAEKGVLPISGPFFTVDGSNTGNGFYALRADSLEKEKEIAAQDPLHKSGVRSHTVEPWLQVID